MTIKEKVGAGLLVLGLAGAVGSFYEGMKSDDDLQNKLMAYFKEDISRKRIVNQKLKLEEELRRFRFRGILDKGILNQGQIGNANFAEFAEEVLKPAQQYQEIAQKYYDLISNPYSKQIIDKYKIILETGKDNRDLYLALFFGFAISLITGIGLISSEYSSKKRKEKK